MNERGSTGPRLTCFISSDNQELGTQVGAALRELGVRTFAFDEVAPGRSLSSSLVSAVLSSDFVCLVMTEPVPRAWIMYEAGIAAGGRRPVVTVLGPEATMAQDLMMSPVVRLSESDESPLREGLAAYVRQVQPLADQLKVNWESALDLAHRPVQSGPASMHGTELERRVMSRFAEVGAMVETRVKVENRLEVDGLVSLPLLGDALNPVVIECKASRTSRSRALREQSVQQLRRGMSAVSAILGILVYDDSLDGDEPIYRVEERSGILITSLHQLEAWSDDEIVTALTILRNRTLHGL